MSILDDDHATVRQKLQAKKTQIGLNSSETFQRIGSHENHEKFDETTRSQDVGPLQSFDRV